MHKTVNTKNNVEKGFALIIIFIFEIDKLGRNFSAFL